jgi:hypothetical protein
MQCNNIRLHGNKFGKQYKNVIKTNKPLRTKQRSKIKRINRKLNTPKRKSMLELDEIFYEQCFNSSNHLCEECGKNLPTIFRNDSGRIVARWRYSHIIQKSIAPQLRHDIENINHLCLQHHQQWETGDKENMRIYKQNRKKFPQFFK